MNPITQVRKYFPFSIPIYCDKIIEPVSEKQKKLGFSLLVLWWWLLLILLLLLQFDDGLFLSELLGADDGLVVVGVGFHTALERGGDLGALLEEVLVVVFGLLDAIFPPYELVSAPTTLHEEAEPALSFFFFILFFPLCFGFGRLRTWLVRMKIFGFCIRGRRSWLIRREILGFRFGLVLRKRGHCWDEVLKDGGCVGRYAKKEEE